MTQPRPLIIGGGPAGLTAAHELLRDPHPLQPLVVEAGKRVGGIARTEEYKGYRFDIGGHRFYTRVTEIEALWHEMMGDEFIEVPRKSRIYYEGKFYDYPLSPLNALQNLGLLETTRVMLSYLAARLRPRGNEENLEEWVTLRFGARLYKHFFKTYTEKVWGMPCTEIRADWAAQRIKELSLFKAVGQALTGRSRATSLIQTFYYPRLGPGQMWERFAAHVETKGGEVRLEHRLVRLHREEKRITHAEIEGADGKTEDIEVSDVISTMPLPELMRCIDPPPPDGVLQAAAGLKHRDFLIVTLMLDHPDPFDDNWIYIHSPEVKVGRIQNFRAWSEALVPDANRACIGMEYFCTRGDDIWEATDEDLMDQAKAELEKLCLADRETVVDSKVIRQPAAYPVYDEVYRQNLHTIKTWLDGIENLQAVGRNGMHRYNNQDHSMLTGLLAARNIKGEAHNLWEVNVERSYLEDFELSRNPGNQPHTAVRLSTAVIVPVFNGRQTLERCLRAIQRQQRQPDQILVVDDASTDGSGALAEAMGVKVLRTGDTNFGPAYARNLAAQAVEEDILIFFDSDVEPHPDTLAHLLAPLERDPEVTATLGSYDDDPECRNIASLYANLRHYHVHQSSQRSTGSFWAGCGAIRKDAFLSVNGFDETYLRPSIEDIELGARITKQGAKILSLPGAQAKHLKEWTVWSLWRADIFQRAFPWAKLMAEGECVPDNLNTKWSERIAALMAVASILFLLTSFTFHPIWVMGALITGGICFASNRDLLGLLYERKGLSGLIGGAILHLLYYLYASLTFAITWIVYRGKRILRMESRNVS